MALALSVQSLMWLFDVNACWVLFSIFDPTSHLKHTSDDIHSSSIVHIQPKTDLIPRLT